MPGFKRAIRPKFELQLAQSARVDFALEVGEVSQSVEVEGVAPLVNTTDATVGQVVGVRETRELPLNGRNYLQLAALVPGTAQYGLRSFYNSGLTDNQGSVISGGAGEDRNEVTLDGVGVKSYMINVAYVPSIDGLREFKVETNPYSAELGRSAGAQIRLESKSGTNQFHGSVFEYLRNSALDAKNYFDRRDLPIPQFQQNQFGGSIGGPIKKDKLWFFGSARYYSVDNFIAGTFLDDGSQGVDDQFIKSALLRMTWQISGRNEINFHDWMKLDLTYIDNWSLLLDLKILLKTVPVVLLGRGAK